MVYDQELTADRSCLPALYNASTCVTACIDIAPIVSSNNCIWPPGKRGLLPETLGEANTDMADTSRKPFTPVRHGHLANIYLSSGLIHTHPALAGKLGFVVLQHRNHCSMYWRLRTPSLPLS